MDLTSVFVFCVVLLFCVYCSVEHLNHFFFQSSSLPFQFSHIPCIHKDTQVEQTSLSQLIATDLNHNSTSDRLLYIYRNLHDGSSHDYDPTCFSTSDRSTIHPLFKNRLISPRLLVNAYK